MKQKKVLLIFLIFIGLIMIFGMKGVKAIVIPSKIWCQNHVAQNIQATLKDTSRNYDVDATCTHAKEYHRVYYCIVCKKETERVYTEGEKLAHSYTDTYTIKASCKYGGMTAPKCASCGKVDYSQKKTTDKLGHNFQGGTCIRCGELEDGVATDPAPTPYVPPVGQPQNAPSTGVNNNNLVEKPHVHTWTPATCTTPKTCQFCGATEGNKLEHDYDPSNGYKCKNCGSTQAEEERTDWDLPCWVDGSIVYGRVTAHLDIDSGVLTISGDGKVTNFTEKGDSRCPWAGKGRGRIKEVVINGKLETIPSYFLYYCTNLTKVTIKYPDKIGYIGEGAFFGCQQLKQLEIPKEISAIGARAFCHCHELRVADLSKCNRLIRIGHEAFRDCWSLYAVVLPESKLKIIGFEAFLNCISLRDLTLPSTIVALGTKGTNTSETGIATGKQLTEEERELYHNTSEYNHVFAIDFSRNSASLNVLTTYVKVLLIQRNIIEESDSVVITVSDGKYKVVLQGASESNDKKIQGKYGSWIVKEDIKDKVTKLFTETKVWYYSANSTLVNNYINQIDKKTGENIPTELVMHELKWNLSKTKGTDNVEATLKPDGTFTLTGTGATIDYANGKAPWNLIRSRIKKVEIGDGITRLGDSLFYYASLTSVTGENGGKIPESLKQIGEGTFFGCTLLKSITLPSSLESIGYRAFCHAESLQKITLPAKIKEIPAESFRDCYELTSVSLAEGGVITRIGNGAFYNDPSLSKIFVITPDLTFIDEHVFTIDFTGSIYKNTLTAWKDTYDEGNYTKLTINYFEDCAAMSAYVSGNEDNDFDDNDEDMRIFNEIEVKNFEVIDSDSPELYLDSDTEETIILRIKQAKKIKVTYSDNSTYIIDLNDKNYAITPAKQYTPQDRTRTYNIAYTSGSIDQVLHVNIELSHDWDSETGICSGCGTKCTHPEFNAATRVEPTCTEAGSEDKTCKTCGFVVHEDLTALGHDYVNGVCTRCGDQEVIDTPPVVETGLVVESEDYDVRTDMKITDVVPETSVGYFLREGVEVTDGASKKILDKNGQQITNDRTKVGTGMKLFVQKGEESKTYVIVVTGDLTGDGLMEDADALKLLRYKANLDTTLTGEYLLAADINKNGTPAEDSDVLKLLRVLANLDNF